MSNQGIHTLGELEFAGKASFAVGHGGTVERERERELGLIERKEGRKGRDFD